MTQFFVQLLQSQLSAVQGGAGDARVLIEADPDSSGGLRYATRPRNPLQIDVVSIDPRQTKLLAFVNPKTISYFNHLFS
jgi:hypothetical protein